MEASLWREYEGEFDSICKQKAYEVTKPMIILEKNKASLSLGRSSRL